MQYESELPLKQIDLNASMADAWWAYTELIKKNVDAAGILCIHFSPRLQLYFSGWRQFILRYWWSCKYILKGYIPLETSILFAVTFNANSFCLSWCWFSRKSLFSLHSIHLLIRAYVAVYLHPEIEGTKVFYRFLVPFCTMSHNFDVLFVSIILKRGLQIQAKCTIQNFALPTLK